LDKCSVCGKPIPPLVAERLKQALGEGPLMCRRCTAAKIRSGQESVLVCKDCDRPIEPMIALRIMAARRRGMVAPRLCRDCYLRLRNHRAVPVVGQREESSARVSEWACVKCGAELEPEEVDQIKRGKTVQCVYCGSAITSDLFR
jgi:DNA-directed RNA polymerase subunit RPC12/RpoP